MEKDSSDEGAEPAKKMNSQMTKVFKNLMQKQYQLQGQIGLPDQAG